MATLTLFAPLADDPITMTTALAPAPVPLGVQLRTARESDAEQVARLHEGDADAAELVERARRTLTEESETLPGCCQVALDETGNVIAYALTDPSGSGTETDGTPTVIDVFTDPPWRGRGLGRAVLIATMRAVAATSERIAVQGEDDSALLRLCRHQGFSEGEPAANAPTAAADATARAVAESVSPLKPEEMAGVGDDVDPAVLAAATTDAEELAAAGDDVEERLATTGGGDGVSTGPGEAEPAAVVDGGAEGVAHPTGVADEVGQDDQPETDADSSSR